LQRGENENEKDKDKEKETEEEKEKPSTPALSNPIFIYFLVVGGRKAG